MPLPLPHLSDQTLLSYHVDFPCRGRIFLKQTTQGNGVKACFAILSRFVFSVMARLLRLKPSDALSSPSPTDDKDRVSDSPNFFIWRLAPLLPQRFASVSVKCLIDVLPLWPGIIVRRATERTPCAPAMTRTDSVRAVTAKTGARCAPYQDLSARVASLIARRVL